jgi:hypothetical protein
MKECDKRKSHISSKLHTICTYSNNVIYPVTKTFTILHYTSPNYTSLHLSTLHFCWWRLFGKRLVRLPVVIYFSWLLQSLRSTTGSASDYPTAASFYTRSCVPFTTRALRSTTGSASDYPTAASFHTRSCVPITTHATIRQHYSAATDNNTSNARIKCKHRGTFE